MKFAIYGTGGFGREVAPLVREHWLHSVDQSDVEPDIVFVDDDEHRPVTANGLPVISFDDLRSPTHRDREIVVAIGNGRVRQTIEAKCLDAGLRMGTVNASSARTMDEVEIGAGTILCGFVTLTSNVHIGRSFHANIYSYVAHDCVIGDYVTFAPRVCCNGNVHIDDHVYVGTAAMFVQGTRDEPLMIGEGAVIGMGSVVTKSVPAYTMVVGNPARAIRTIERP